MHGSHGPGEPARGGATEVFLAFLGLGLTSFGGPVAHLAYFRDEFVARRRCGWQGGLLCLAAIFLPGC